MNRGTRTAATLVWALLLVLGLSGRAAAQGVTTSAVTGRVTSAEDAPVAGATVTATNTATGATFRVVTRADGRYLLTGMQPGGPYRLAVSALGYGTQTRDNLSLRLSQTAEVNFHLATQALMLEGITVNADRNAVISAGRTGTAAVVSDSAISRMPTITRDFTELVRLVPQLSSSGSGTSAGGRNFRFNSIQIDGAANNDLFGLASSGTPGGQAGTKAITLEAIQEVQVVLAPFDVRQGGFTGAGINAVTRSGTNDLRGSFAFFGRNENLVGNYEFDQAGTTIRSTDIAEFKQNEAAFSLGGPIIRDRAFFFFAGEIARREAPTGAFIGPNAQGQPSTFGSNLTINPFRVDSVLTVLQNRYGYEAGTSGLINLRRESNNFFGRLDFNLGANNRLTLRHNYVDAWDDNFGRSDAGFALGRAGYVFNSTTNSTVAQLNSTLGNQFYNEFRVGYTTVRDNRDPASNPFPRIEVDLPTGSCQGGGTCRVLAGAENFSVANALDQNALEVTNDLSFSRGIHSFTVGTSNQFFNFSNLFARNLYGLYRFSGIAALDAGTPSRYEGSFFNETVPGATPRAEFPVQALSFYLQDRMSLTERLTVTPGIRLDVTRFPDAPSENPAFTTAFNTAFAAQGLGSFTRRTSDIPESTTTVNPRVGFNWDVTGTQATQVRGGVGVFAGRTPYVWISNAYGNTGLDYTRFTCSGTGSTSTSRAPAFVADPLNQPRACVNAAGVPQPVSAVPNEINTVDPDFKMPQVVRYSAAIDQRLPGNLIGTLEFLGTDALNDPTYRDLTLADSVVGGNQVMVEGRPVYRRVQAPGFGNVYDVTNTSENYSYSITGQLQRPFVNGWEASIAYTYGRSEDVNGLTSSQAGSNFRFNPIDDNPNDPALRPSLNDVRHRWVGSFTRQFRFDAFGRAPTDISLIYVGESGRPYSYTYSGDVNGDGQDANDLIYVPASASEIEFRPRVTTGSSQNPFTPAESWANLNEFIESVACLREARGTVVQRNACRLPWVNRFDVRVAQTLPTLRGHAAEFTVDISNFANLLSRRWGVDQFVGNQADQVLSRFGASTAPGRAQMNGFGPRTSPFNVGDLGSRYQIAAGIRYTF